MLHICTVQFLVNDTTWVIPDTSLNVIFYFIYIVFLLFVTNSYDEAKGTMDSGFPRSIEEDFPGMDDEVDAAVYHYGNVKIS